MTYSETEFPSHYSRGVAAKSSGARPLAFLLSLVLAASALEFGVRSLIPAYEARSDVFTDFAEPYAGAKLLLAGRNPYDVAAVREVLSRHVVPNGFLVPLNVPSFYLLVIPFSLLPWQWANFLWVLCGIASVVLIGILLLRITRLSPWEPGGAMLLAFVALFAPFHTALHVGNGIVICCALLVLSVFLASRGRDASSGIVLALGAAMKPQLGLALLLYFVLLRRRRLAALAIGTGAVMAMVIVAQLGAELAEALEHYRLNSHYWFGPGGQNDFGVGSANRLHLIHLQVLIANMPLSRALVNATAALLGIAAAAGWVVAVRRTGSRFDLLAISTAMAVSLLPVYHRSYDAAVLALALGWSAVNLWNRAASMRRCARAVMLVGTGFLIPGGPFMAAAGSYLPERITESLVWKVVVVPYQAWAVVGIAVLLLAAMFARQPQATNRTERHTSRVSEFAVQS